MKLDSGGGDMLVSLASFDNRLKVYRVNNINGSLTETDSEGLVGSNFTEIHYYDTPILTTDYIYLTEAGANNIRIYALDTLTDTLSETATSPRSNPFEMPGALETVGNKLFVLNPQANPGPDEDDNMHIYIIDPATGDLTFVPTAYGTGDGAVGIHAVGNFLYIGNQISADITAYEVNPASTVLTSLDGGTFIAAGEVNPHFFADITLSDGLSGLYVATSNNVAAYTLNTATGALTTIAGSPFAGLTASPGDIRR